MFQDQQKANMDGVHWLMEERVIVVPLTEIRKSTSEAFFSPFSSVQFSCSVVSNSLLPHESQHTRPPCPSPAPGVYSDSCPSSW